MSNHKMYDVIFPNCLIERGKMTVKINKTPLWKKGDVDLSECLQITGQYGSLKKRLKIWP